MTAAAKPVVPRRRAEQDLDEIVDHLAGEAGLDVALRFIDAYGRACDHLSRHPASGSPRIGWELDLPGLRSWPIPGFGYLVFYENTADRVDVWRVLHGARDIPRWLRDTPKD